jgi:hypothetical protein
MGFSRLGKAAGRAAIVWIIAWPLVFVSWYWSLSVLFGSGVDGPLVGGITAWVFSVLLAGYEFWRSFHRDDPPADPPKSDLPSFLTRK